MIVYICSPRQTRFHMEKVSEKIRSITDLNKRAAELDKKLIKIRGEIHSLFWDLIEIKKKIKS